MDFGREIKVVSGEEGGERRGDKGGGFLTVRWEFVASISNQTASSKLSMSSVLVTSTSRSFKHGSSSIFKSSTSSSIVAELGDELLSRDLPDCSVILAL